MKKNTFSSEKIIALAGNPNVGKSTLFNNLTGMKQHTGNWTGKTVDVAKGYAFNNNNKYTFIDLPGAYSLFSDSPEEEIARDFLCFEKYDAVVIVCDATNLERNLNMVLQIREFSSECILCLNLMDEAKKKGIHIDSEKLSELLKIPVIETVAKTKSGFSELFEAINVKNESEGYVIQYPDEVEGMISEIEKNLPFSDSRWLALKLLENNEQMNSALETHFKTELINDKIKKLISETDTEKIKDSVTSAVISEAEKISKMVISYKKNPRNKDRILDRIFTGKISGIFCMIMLFGLIFYITISGANYPSDLLSGFLFSFEDDLISFLNFLYSPKWLTDLLVNGVYRVLSWVISVMLPPMAIFFPLFTLLEDFGYLPRIAYNLDKPFQKCNACGKQALTMCMGFGCNACGVTGCRIINSKRERLMAILTNSFVPCNGRFPALITLILIFFTGSYLISSLYLTTIIILSVAITFAASYFLSKTFLKGESSPFLLELPSYRFPQVGKVILRSVKDRTVTVLLRAIAVAAPAGAVIWIMSNVTFGNNSIFSLCSSFLNPLGELMGLDGVILMAFILGAPANEIVLPLIIMGYMSQGNLTEIASLEVTKRILTDNGWNILTAINTIIFSLMHWPCTTTLLTIKKETGSLKWTVLSALLPTMAGFLLCVFSALTARLFLLT